MRHPLSRQWLIPVSTTFCASFQPLFTGSATSAPPNANLFPRALHPMEHLIKIGRGDARSTLSNTPSRSDGVDFLISREIDYVLEQSEPSLYGKRRAVYESPCGLP
ncbi:hypothetical protein BDZ94DRAFT_326319 [Collybia nuda]|uniref:Uncharacterized protein n=1 Tax=Collybia nuda TaxID=64659 RepID=A0A9P6CMC9_9AGAR|nr:hypothetical protein BDZ94DRAFT_326319 [Collybia nuda]